MRPHGGMGAHMLACADVGFCRFDEWSLEHASGIVVLLAYLMRNCSKAVRGRPWRAFAAAGEALAMATTALENIKPKNDNSLISSFWVGLLVGRPGSGMHVKRVVNAHPKSYIALLSFHHADAIQLVLQARHLRCMGFTSPRCCGCEESSELLQDCSSRSQDIWHGELCFKVYLLYCRRLCANCGFTVVRPLVGTRLRPRQATAYLCTGRGRCTSALIR